jgi:hypothetical protein
MPTTQDSEFSPESMMIVPTQIKGLLACFVLGIIQKDSQIDSML